LGWIPPAARLLGSTDELPHARSRPASPVLGLDWPLRLNPVLPLILVLRLILPQFLFRRSPCIPRIAAPLARTTYLKICCLPKLSFHFR
jgi:hypothetical protein